MKKLFTGLFVVLLTSQYAYSYDLNITLTQAGELINQVDLNTLDHVSKLTISGDVNGTDILVIRKMENLKELDISNTNIVSGGASYYDGYTTKNNIIGTYMFSGLSNLEQIKTPQSITAIYSYAFGGCISLTEYVFTERIREIGTAAFFNCQSLKSAIIPSNITMIRYNAFAGCENLKSVTFSDSDEEIFVDTPFIQCPIETIYVGRNIKYYEFDGSPFAYLTTLKDVTLSKHAFLTISGWMSICFRCIIQNLKRVTCVTDSFNDMTQWWNKKKS